MIHLFLKLIPPIMVAYCLILDGWSDFSLPLCWPGKGGSSDKVTCLLWPDLFLGPIIYLPSLVLIYPWALWRPRVWPMAQYPYPGLSSLQAYFLYCFYSNILYARILNITNCNWVKQSRELRDTIGPIYSFIVCCI